MEEISYNSDRKHRDGNGRGATRRPNVQLIGVPGREKVIEEIFIELKKTLICRMKRYQIYSRISGDKRGSIGLHIC